MTEPTPTSQSPPEATPNHKRRKAVLWFTAAVVFTGLIWFLLWFFHFRFYESTDDAYANGNLININSSVPGSVIGFYADDTDLVEEGQLLVELDSTEYQAIYEKEFATLASTVLQVKQLYDEVKVALATLKIQKIEVLRTRYDYKTRLPLHGTGAISEEDFVHTKDAFMSAKASLKQARFALKVARDAAGTTKIRNHPLIEQQKAAVREAYYNLKHCRIVAPTRGYIAQRTVNVGQWVSHTTNMMAIIPTNYVWVDANFKETQLTYMRVGQPATVELDIYGSKVQYDGHVIGIGSGTGSVFSIIPPQNATGNWIKIVQRLPVRISLNPDVVKRFPTRLGLSAEVTVDITNQNLPILSQVPSIKPIATTNVYNIHLEDVNNIMDALIDDML